MRGWVAALFLVTMLAGCAGNPGMPAPAGDEIPIEVTDTTGAIRGVVVDEAIRPLKGAQVTLKLPAGERAANTTDAGAFAFSGLNPGTYFLTISRFGFNTIQQSTEVVAGQRDPPVLRVQLTRDPSQVAYMVAESATGFIVCTTSVVAVCGAPDIVLELIVFDFFGVCVGPVTGDRFGFYLFYDPNATMIQAEMVWDSTQSLSTELTLSMENIEGCEAASDSYQEGVSGNSPIYNIADAEDIAAGTIGGTCGIWYSIFSGDTVGTPGGVTFQQKFDIFSNAFYGYTPPEGWRLTVDGQPPQPPT